MIFDTIELVTLVLALIAFIFVLIAYFMAVKKEMRKLLRRFLIVACFILLNRVFTNIEALAFKDFFNLLEHLCMGLAALVFVYVAWLVYNGGAK